MKTTLNAKELRELHACSEGLETFIKAHQENTVTLSQALDSNGWDDTWWYISNAYAEFTQEQKNDLHLIGCDWAERTLENFEKQFPEDKRPREAIEAKRKFVKNEITEEELSAAWSAAWSAAESAAWSAWSAAWSARSAAWSAAWSARSAESAWSAALKEMTTELKELFIKWEKKQ